MNIVSSCMEPAWTRCAYLDTPPSVLYGCSDKIIRWVVQKRRHKPSTCNNNHRHCTHCNQAKKNQSLESWSKMIVPFVPTSEISSPLRGIWQNALQLGILSESHSQALFNWTALHAIKYFLSSKFKAWILINTELITAFLFLEISSLRYILAD